MDGGGKAGHASSSVKRILQSGSPRVLNASRVAAQLKLREEPQALLFKTTALNRSVLFKELNQQNLAEGDNRMTVGTKVYVPFDGEHPEEGGMTVFFSKYTFQNAMRELVDLSDKQRAADLNTDIEVLTHLDILPTFAPFLVKDLFDRKAITADPLYCVIPEDEWVAIQAYIRGRFGQILTAVAGGAQTKQAAMDSLIDKLWDLKDIPALKGLAAAFGLDPEDSVEIFYAWKGILYFAWVFTAVREQVFELIAWFDTAPVLLNAFLPNRRAEPKAALEKARRAVSRMQNRVESVLTDYDHAFEELFVTGSGPHRFITFLKGASEHFQTCGAGLGLLQHGYEVWDSSTKRFPNRLANDETITQVLQAILDIMPE
jgi:hypothetical protein